MKYSEQICNFSPFFNIALYRNFTQIYENSDVKQYVKTRQFDFWMEPKWTKLFPICFSMTAMIVFCLLLEPSGMNQRIVKEKENR